MKNSKLQSRCCGGGGGILLSDLALSDKIAQKRVEEALETGVDTLVTSCPTCEQVLKKAATDIGEATGKTLAVRNLADIIWKGLKS
jgi:Fe-S oxidoreductase